MRIASTVSLSLLVPFLGCTMGSSIVNGQATIVPPAIDAGTVPALTVSGPATVTAGDAADSWFLLASNDPEQLRANLDVWSEQAAQGLARDLQTIGGQVGDGAERSLEVTITSASGEVGFAKSRVAVSLQVRTGDGVTSTFDGAVSSMRGMVFCSEQAMQQAITAALQDERIRSYLQS